jgi:hypothetical protein
MVLQQKHLKSEWKVFNLRVCYHYINISFFNDSIHILLHKDNTEFLKHSIIDFFLNSYWTSIHNTEKKFEIIL